VLSGKFEEGNLVADSAIETYVYVDDHTDSIPDGPRVIKSENGDIYVGILKLGVFEGVGTVIFRDGSIFTGVLKGGEPNG